MKKFLLTLTILCFFITSVIGICPVYAQEFSLPAPGQMVALSPVFSPALLKGIKLDPKNPFRFYFFVDTGDDASKGPISSSSRVIASEGPHTGHAQVASKQSLKEQSTKLIKYFLASLTIPEKDLWVNLSPYEKDRIVPPEFGQTEMGRDLLAEDYLLKQITASLIYPESKLGKEFWTKVYAQAQAKYGTTNIPINTFNKVWIVPEKAVVYENGGTAFVLENHLKVMLEQDYLSMQKHKIPPLFYKEGARGSSNDINALGSQIIREIVIPALTKEVNEGKNFSQLRQVFYSLILATWYKKKIKHSILNKIYSNQNKISGVTPLVSLRATKGSEAISERTTQDVEYIYQQYLKAFKKGVYNYIKEEPDPIANQFTPRKYFSGGVEAGQIVFATSYVRKLDPAQMAEIKKEEKSSIEEIKGDLAMNTEKVNLKSFESQQTTPLKGRISKMTMDRLLEELKSEDIHRIQKGRWLLIGPGEDAGEIESFFTIFPEAKSLDVIGYGMERFKDQLKSRNFPFLDKVKFDEQNIQKTTFSDHAFDAVYSSRVFDWTLFYSLSTAWSYDDNDTKEQLRKMTAGLKRILKPNGVYFTTISDREPFIEAGFDLKFPYAHGKADHTFVAVLDKSLWKDQAMKSPSNTADAGTNTESIHRITAVRL